MRKAFVTGATGFLGTNLIHELRAQGWEVIVFHLPSEDLSRFAGMGLEFTEGNILDRESVLYGLPLDGKDVTVFHLAGDTTMWRKHRKRQYEINVLGTRNVAEAALERGVGKFVYTSSISAYGFHKGRVDERIPSNAMTCRMNYNKTKFLAEQEVRKAVEKGLDGVILNPCNMLGPYDPKGWSSLIMSVVDEKVPGVTRGVGTFAHVADVAKAHIAAAEKGRTGENYLLGGVEIGFKDIYHLINEMLGKNMNFRTIPTPLFRMAMYGIRAKAFFRGEEPILTYPRFKRLTGRVLCDDSKARKELSFDTGTVKHMLEDSYEWLVKEGITRGKMG